MTPASSYLQKSRELIDIVEKQIPIIQRVADRFTKTILAGRMVHVFASGHSRIMVEEMWPRYGSFPGFNPIVELSLTFHNLVVGANGQRQAMFLENVSGLAQRIVRNFDLSKDDSALVIEESELPEPDLSVHDDHAEAYRGRLGGFSDWASAR